MTTKTEAIKALLTAKTHPDLSSLYNFNMEVQVNVAKDNGELIQEGDFRGKGWRAWSDGITTWKSFRIPFNANSEPTYEDKPLVFSLEQHCEGIGMTGWDWKNKLSHWVAYDFDAIVGHSDRHAKKLTDLQLKEVNDNITKIPFATLRLSTSGKGLHLYVFLEPVSTNNHTEHAALARSILSMMSGLVAFDFASRLDICGGNMWVWHRKMLNTNGLSLLKQGCQLKEIPSNWRDHCTVIKRQSKKVVPKFVTPDLEDEFLELCGQRVKVPLDDDHKKLIEYLQSNNCSWWWDSDNHMLVTHTFHLKEAHSALSFKGKFSTLASGSERGYDHNCFMYPMRGGCWAVRRYSPGVKEDDSWEQDGKSYTKCYFNKNPDLGVVARLHDGMEHEKGGYVFKTVENIQKALLELDIDLHPLPSFVMDRKAWVKFIKGDNKLSVSIEAELKDDTTKLKGWYLEKKKWIKIFRSTFVTTHETDVQENYDDLVRHIISDCGEDAGWVVSRTGIWCEEPLTHVRLFLSNLGNDLKKTNQILGKAVESAWKIVNKPFQPEYPGDREWNRNAAQFTVPPNPDIDNLSYPTYMKVLNHVGSNLNQAIKEHAWCKSNGIATGSDYLKLWLACVLKRPDQPVPYLAFFGDQDCGKSTFHEMMNFIITDGLVGGDIALTNTQGFNGELENAIICYVEETDLGNKKFNKVAYNRIKDWVTSPFLTIHPKHGTPYRVNNNTHWIHVVNDRDELPIFPGDTRITLCQVSTLDKAEIIGKRDLENLFRKEASDFLAALLNLDIPDISDRLMLPVVETIEKKQAALKNQTMLEQFIKEECHYIPGATVTVVEFYEKFQLWLDESDRPMWSKNKIGRDLPPKFQKGRLTTCPHQCYGNLSFKADTKPGIPWQSDGTFLRPKPVYVDLPSNQLVNPPKPNLNGEKQCEELLQSDTTKTSEKMNSSDSVSTSSDHKPEGSE